MKTAPLFLAILVAAPLFASDATRYIAATFTITGELTANTTVLLTVGEPSKVVWTSQDTEQPDYALIIPSPVMTAEDSFGVSAMLLARYPDENWSVISEASLPNNQACLLGVGEPTATIHIHAEPTTKEAFMQQFAN